MKKILAILSIILTMFISSETLARPHGGFHHGGYHGPHMMYHGGGHHHGRGWLFPLGMLVGSALTYGATRETYVQQPIYVQQPVYQPQPVYYQQPVYQGSPVIIRDTNCYTCY
jgi:hypothetical protein